MTLDPNKLRLSLGLFPDPNLLQDSLDEIAILHRLLRAVHPIVSFPVDEPFRHTFDGVLTVAVDRHGSSEGGEIESAFYGSELSPLIGLPGASQGFGKIPGKE